MIKKEILTLNTETVRFMTKQMTLQKTWRKCSNKYIVRKQNVVFPGQINLQIGGAVAPLFLMFKKEILKGATSKHAKKMYFGYETGQNSSDFKKKLIFR